MEFLVNDCSLHMQFPTAASFKESIVQIMGMRDVMRKYGRELYCHRNIALAQVTNDLNMQQVMGMKNIFRHDEVRAILSWLQKHGPFWDEERHHGRDDYLECNGEIVTDTAVGEAAYRCVHGAEHRLVSFTPSAWEYSPVVVNWQCDDDSKEVNICNHWDKQSVECALQSAPLWPQSWSQLDDESSRRFTNLSFAVDCFAPLSKHPFALGAAREILRRLHVLEQIKCGLTENGRRTLDAERLIKDHFHGKKAWFSDSSDTEKRNFKNELTFRHPQQAGKQLFCPWHGKVKTPQYRIHFSWPLRIGEPLFVVYIGPKITKR